MSRVRRWWAWVEGHPPPGPFRPGFWRSPLRGPWLTAVFGLVLLIGVPILFLTGLASYAAYNPDIGRNDLTPDAGFLRALRFDWPTRPAWLYRFNQGVHVTLGVILVPVLLAKLWSVIPKLFEWPPARSPSHLLDRLSLFLLVGGAGFQFATGLVNIQYWYVFPAGFYTAHLYGAWVFTAAFVVHVAFRFGRMRTALRSRPLRQELRTKLADTRPEPADPDGLVSPDPAPATISRRGAVGLVGAGSLALLVVTAGQSLGGPFRRLALLAPRGQSQGDGANDFQVNKTAAVSGVTAEQAGPRWRLEVRAGDRSTTFSRADLLAMPQHRADLAIACVEGWSTGNQGWSGVRLRDLAASVGADEAATVFVESLQEGGSFRSTTLRRNQIQDGDSLLALRVNDADISLDHGFPARVVVPSNPGVHNTKWVTRLSFEA